MYKILLLLITVSLFSFAKESLKDENVQILAQNLEIKNNIVNASGEIVVYSQNYYITANRLIYNQTDATLELFDDVNIIRNNDILSYSQYMFIDLNKEINNFKPILLLDNTNKLWFNAKRASKEKDYFDLEESTLSSCDCKDPAWSISFSSGDYNTTKKWINAYNTTLYIKDVPIFYTPYFGFPTDKTRRTGFLKPTIGYSQSEGFVYAQPIYFAPKANYDFEYIPQIRSSRGKGHSIKYRYVDSIYSSLNFEAGMFIEKESYQEENDLTNRRHRGWNLEYKRSKLFSSGDNSDGLLIQSEYMNDVDYINTKYDSSITNNTDNSIESKFKYFFNTNKYYIDIETNHYEDISDDSEDDELQEIPAVSFHNYSNGLFNNFFTNSINVSTNRQTRNTGVGGKTTELYIPIGYHTYLFDEYLNFSFNEEINYSNIKYTNSNYNEANYGENNHVFSFYTDLVKSYTNYIHTLNFNVTYIDSNTFKETGDIYDASNSNTDELESFAISQSKNSLSLGFEQSIYRKSTLKEIVNHKINQIYSYNKNMNRYEKDSLENDLAFNFDYGSLSSRLIYNYLIKDFTTNSATLRLEKDDYFAKIYYTHLLTVNDDEISDEEKTITYNFGFNFLKYYSFSYKEEYDLIDSESNNKEYIFKIDEKCWAIDFKLIDSLVASDTTSRTNAYRQKIIYIEFNLKQLFQIEQNYKLQDGN